MQHCKVEGCENNIKATGYCSKHYSQVKRSGKTKSINRLSENDFIDYGESTIIILRDNLGNEKATAVIDSADLPAVKKHKWYVNNQGYAMTRINRNKKLFLHHLFFFVEKGKVVDHIDGNTLNNKRENLRECTIQQNKMNLKTYGNNSSGKTGVRFDKRRQMWTARINVNKKEIYLGSSADFIEAVNLREAAEIKYFGEFRRKEAAAVKPPFAFAKGESSWTLKK